MLLKTAVCLLKSEVILKKQDRKTLDLPDAGRKIFDLHSDVPSLLLRRKLSGENLSLDEIMSRFYRAENLCGVIFSVFVSSDVVSQGKACENAMAQISLTKKLIAESRGYFLVPKFHVAPGSANLFRSHVMPDSKPFFGQRKLAFNESSSDSHIAPENASVSENPETAFNRTFPEPYKTPYNERFSASFDFAQNKNKIPVFLSLEGAEPIGSPENLEDFASEGISALSLTWSRDNDYAGGCRLSKNPGHRGLARKGRRLLREAERLGIAVDLAHSGDFTAREILSCFGGKVFISHTGCKFLTRLDRNAGDDLLSEVGRRGGVVGICGVSMLCGGGLQETAKHVLHAEEISGGRTALGLDISDSRVERRRADCYEIDGNRVVSEDNIPSYKDADLLAEELKKSGLNEEKIARIFSLNAYNFMFGRR